LGELAADLVELGPDRGLVRADVVRAGVVPARVVPASVVKAVTLGGRIDLVLAPGCPKAAHVRYPNGTTEIGKRAAARIAVPHPAAGSFGTQRAVVDRSAPESPR
jgi:hypothetical protein